MGLHWEGCCETHKDVSSEVLPGPRQGQTVELGMHQVKFGPCSDCAGGDMRVSMPHLR